MRDIELSSKVISVKDMPKETDRIMVVYDNRGWAIRCYDKNGSKLITLVDPGNLNPRFTVAPDSDYVD